MVEQKEQSSPYIVRLINRAAGFEAYQWGKQLYLQNLSPDTSKTSHLKSRLVGFGCATASILLPSIWESFTDRDFNGAKFDLALWVDTLTTGSMVLGGCTPPVLNSFQP